MSAPRFSLGRHLYKTPGIEASGIPVKVLTVALARHAYGDFGDLDPEDCATNERAIATGAQVLSSYEHSGTKFWIITDGDRSRTTILLPHEY